MNEFPIINDPMNQMPDQNSINLMNQVHVNPGQDLIDALLAGQIDRINELLNLHGGINAKDENGNTPLMLVTNPMTNPNALYCMQKLLEIPGVDVNIPDNDGNTLLIRVESQLDCYKELLGRDDTDVNANQGKALLDAVNNAIVYGNMDPLRELFKRKDLDMNVKDQDDNTPLMLVCNLNASHNAEGSAECLTMLTSKIGINNIGLNVNDKNNRGRYSFNNCS